jgi:hypothetical protein
MAMLYPSLGHPQHIEAPEGGFTFLTISNLINGSPFYVKVAGKIVALCEGARELQMPLNMHRATFLVPAHGDVLVMESHELAREESAKLES